MTVRCLSECRVRPKTEASFRITARLQPHWTSRPPQTSIRPNTIGMNGVCMICDPKQNQRKAMQNASGIAVFSMDPRNGQRLRINSPSPMPRAARASEMGIWVFAAFIGDSQLFPIAAFRFDEERLRLSQRRGAAFRGGVSGWTWKCCRNSFFSCIG